MPHKNTEYVFNREKNVAEGPVTYDLSYIHYTVSLPLLLFVFNKFKVTKSLLRVP